jgi:enoyl-CoA hydratase/carnithine racemase
LSETAPLVLLTRQDWAGGPVALVAINRPDKLNALSGALNRELAETFGKLSEDAELRCVVLTGAGDRAFIGGADIYEMAELDIDGAESFITGLHEACAAIRACPVPVVARIRGFCFGGGLEVAASCDLRIADTSGVFGMPEVRVGVPSVIEAALLPGLVGWGKAREMVLFAENMSASEARACGFIERLVEPGDLDAEVEKAVDAVLAGAPQAIRLQKQLIGEWEKRPLDDAVMAGIRAFRRAYATGEPQTKMRAFVERRRSGN